MSSTASGIRGFRWLGGRTISVRIRSRSWYTPPSASERPLAGDAFVEDRGEGVISDRSRGTQCFTPSVCAGAM